MAKAISTVIATLLMLIITIALVGFSYSFITSFVGSKTGETFSVVDTYRDTINIINDGTGQIVSFRSVKIDGNNAIFRVEAQDNSLVAYWDLDAVSANTTNDKSGKGNDLTLSAPNLAVNPGFEDGASSDANNWSEGTNHARNNEKSHSGSFSLKSTATSGTATNLADFIPVTRSTTYTLAGFIYRDASFTGNAYFDLDDGQGQGGSFTDCHASSSTSITGKWQSVSCSFTTGANTTGVKVRSVTDSTLSGSVWFDDVQITKGPTWSEGKYGNALQFDGIDDYARNPSPNSLPLGNSSRTMEAWVKPQSYGSDTYHGIIAYGLGQCNKGTLLSMRGDGNNAGWLSQAFWCNDMYQTSGDKAPLNQWSHAVFTYDRTIGKLYLNGNLVATNTFSNVSTAQGSLRIGMTDDPERYFTGAIDEVKIYNKALSEQEIKANYNMGSYINAGQAATIKIYNQLTQGNHQVRICTASMCNTAILRKN